MNNNTSSVKVYTIEDLNVYGNRMHINTAFEIVINGIAGYIVYKHSTKAMGYYKYYILSTIFWAFLMDFHISFIFSPYPIFPSAILCSSGIITKHLDWIYGRVIPYCMLHFLLSMIGGSIIYGFMYQYYSLKGKEEFFQSFKGIVILFIIMLIYPLPSLITLLCTLDREGAIEYVRTKYKEAFNLFITAPCNTFVWNTLSKVYFAIVLIQMIFVCIIAWILFFLIQRKLYELRLTLSVQTLRARRQLSIALFLQLIVPAGILATPIFVMIGSILLNLENMREFSLYAMHILAFHSCSNAVLVVTVITPYRKVLFRWWRTLTHYPRKLFCKPSPQSSIANREGFTNTTSVALSR